MQQYPDGHVYHVMQEQQIDGDVIVADYLLRRLTPGSKKTINATFVFLSDSNALFNVTLPTQITLNKKHLYDIKVLSHTAVSLNKHQMYIVELEFTS